MTSIFVAELKTEKSEVVNSFSWVTYLVADLHTFGLAVGLINGEGHNSGSMRAEVRLNTVHF